MQNRDLNDPSFFRQGGLLVPFGDDQVHIQIGKNLDGSWYVDLKGKTGHVRSHMTPRQMFRMCHDTLGAMGYTGLNIKPPDMQSYDMMLDEADRA